VGLNRAVVWTLGTAPRSEGIFRDEFADRALGAP